MKFLFGTAVAATLLVATPALASTIFTFTLTGTDNATFTLASDAPFYNDHAGSYSYATFAHVAGIYSGVAGYADFSIFDAASGGGFQLTFPNQSYLAPEGPVIYRGTLTNPSFAPGTFTFTHDFNVGPVNDTLVISDGSVSAAVPEPATWSAMMLGFLAFGWSLRRSRARRLAPLLAR